MIPLTKKKIVPTLILLTLFVLFLFHYLKFWNFLFDDTFISMRYAKNFIQGKGLVFNPFEKVEGYTNFLWVMLMVLFFQSGHFLFAIKLFCLFCVFLSFLLTYRVAQKIYRNPLVSLGAVLLMAGNMYYVYHMIEGLETALFSFLVLWAVYCFINEEEKEAGGFSSAIPLALTYLTRPDGLIIIAVFGLFKLNRAWSDKKVLREDYVWLTFLITAITLHLSWRFFYYGQLWPNSYYAKKMGLFYLAKGWDALRKLQPYIGFFWCLPFALFSLFSPKNRRWTIFLWLIVLSRVFFILFSGGTWVGIGGRFFLPVAPFFFMLFLHGVDSFSVFSFKKLSLQRRHWRAVLIIAIVLGGNYRLPQVNREISRFIVNYASNLRKAHMALAIWLKKNASPDDVLAVQDAGAIPYFSELKIIDQLGLNDEYIAKLPGRYYYRRIGNYVMEQNPTYIVLISDNYEKMSPPGYPDKEIFFHPEFKSGYELTKRYTFEKNYYLFLYKKLASHLKMNP